MADFRATFRIMAEDLNPTEISDLLGLTPDHAHSQGSPRIGKSGRQYSNFKEGLWELRSRLPLSNSLADHLTALIDVLV